MKRVFAASLHLQVVFLTFILAWAVVSCSGSVQPPNSTVSATPTSPSTTTVAPTSSANLCPTPASGKTSIPFESLAQGYRLSSTQSRPALLLAMDSGGRDVLAPLIDAGHQALLNRVDLERKAVLFAAWGVRPSGGGSITICNLSTADTGLDVNVILLEDDPNVAKVDASTFPYHLVLIDRLDVPSEGNLHYRLLSDDTLLAEGELP